MSVKLMDRVWDFPCPLGEKVVLLKLADCGSDQGESIYPKKTTVAEKCGCTTRHVHLVIQKYIDAGLLAVEEKGGGRGKLTVYTLDPDKLNSEWYSVNVTQTVNTVPINSERHTVNSERRSSDTIYKNHTEPSLEPCRADVQSASEAIVPELVLEEEPNCGKPDIGKPTTETPEIVDDVSDVILHLNKVAGKHHKLSTESSRKFIEALIAKSATIDEMKLVAEYKASRWKGDGEMDECLRPSTLYRACNFDGYLVEAEAWNARGRVALKPNGVSRETSAQIAARRMKASMERMEGAQA